jgi:hypothetical protein
VAETTTVLGGSLHRFSTDEMRNLALAVNDNRLNQTPVSVNQVREILRAIGAWVEEADRPATKRLADELRQRLIDRYPAFAHKGRGKVGLSLSSPEWRAILDALSEPDGDKRRSTLSVQAAKE